MATLKKMSAVSILMLGMSSVGLAQADVIFSSISGSTTYGSVDFSLSGAQLTATVTDLVFNPNSVASNISGLGFTLSSAVLVSSGLASQTTGQFITFDNSGTVGTLSTGGALGWNAGNNTTQALVSVLGSQYASWGTISSYQVTRSITCLGGNNTPCTTIIGYPSSTSGNTATYSNAGGSIKNSGSHNPFSYETATFVWNVSGLSSLSSSDFSNVGLFFGTTGNLITLTNTPPTPPTPVPEPNEMGMFGLGLFMLGSMFYVERGKRKQHNDSI